MRVYQIDLRHAVDTESPRRLAALLFHLPHDAAIWGQIEESKGAANVMSASQFLTKFQEG